MIRLQDTYQYVHTHTHSQYVNVTGSFALVASRGGIYSGHKNEMDA